MAAINPEAAPVFEAALTPVKANYRRYVLGLLLLVCLFNYLDRQVINILAESIRKEFGLRDWQLGALTGLSFALLYSVLSLPMARIGDSGRRSPVLIASLAAWSVFTITCGLAQNVVQLFMSRILVGCGEAGGTPNAHALVADYAPKAKRASALAIYSLGMPLGGLCGMILGGVILDRYGWRTAFLVAGAPGLVLACVAAFTLRDAPRAPAAQAPPSLTTLPALRLLASNRSFVWMTLGGAMVAFVNYGQAAFLAAFYFRNHHDGLAALAGSVNSATGWSMGPPGALGLTLGLIAGVGGIAGMITGGRITDWAARRDMRAYVDVQVLAGLARIPCFATAMLSHDLWMALAATAAHQFCMSTAAPPAYASIQGLAPPNLRSTASSVFSFGLTAIGLGFGALCVGALSDRFARTFGAADGLRWALLATEIVLVCAVSAIFMSRRTFVQDTVS